MIRHAVMAGALLFANQAPPTVIDIPTTWGGASHGWKGWADVGPIRSDYATIRVPLGAPADTVFGYVGVQDQAPGHVVDFTQIGFAWAVPVPGGYAPPGGYASYPAGEPFVFAWTEYGNDVGTATWRIGPLLDPGQVLAVRVVATAPHVFVDQYRTAHGWVTLANATFSVQPPPLVWTTMAEAYGTSVPVTFLSRSWALASGRLRPLSRGTVTAP